MHLVQTKQGSRGSGGPQYYFHDVPEHIKLFLRKKGAVKVALMTPYGATPSHFFAVSKDHKLDKAGKVQAGKVGHDRIQQGGASQSIGETIRYWYKLKAGDFHRIDIDVEVMDDRLYLTPLRFKYTGGHREYELGRIERPLTFTREYKSALWLSQLERIKTQSSSLYNWSLDEICRISRVHCAPGKLANIAEQDLLRASGPLKHLGIQLGPYLVTGYDCQSNFLFDSYPPYEVPVEVKKRSRDFKYQEKNYGKERLFRAVVLCAEHTHKTMHKHIDVVELQALCEFPR